MVVVLRSRHCEALENQYISHEVEFDIARGGAYFEVQVKRVLVEVGKQPLGN